jgi:outer membrane translocation and assembly module TamA
MPPIPSALRADPGPVGRRRGARHHDQELRYHHASGLGAAVFYDVGNVFATIKDIGFDLKHSVGFGLRYDSPVGLLRLDIGFPLTRGPTDRSYQWFFSFGQAF